MEKPAPRIFRERERPVLNSGEEVTVKRLYREGDKVRLKPQNGEHEDLVVPGEAVKIQGRVVYVILRLADKMSPSSPLSPVSEGYSPGYWPYTEAPSLSVRMPKAILCLVGA